MATTSQTVAGFVGNSDKHTLSQVADGSAFVSLQSVLTVLESFQVRDAALIRDAELDKDSEIPAKRERWSIFAGRHLAMGLASDEVRKLPTVHPDNLMGGKPILDHLERERRKFRSLSNGFASRSQDPMERNPGFVEHEWIRCDSIASFIADFSKHFVGSAEEQPTPREESRPVIGTGIACDTGRGESICPAADALLVLIGNLSSPDLLRISDAVLDLIEDRGISVGWSSVE